MLENVVFSIRDMTGKLLLDKASPNLSLVEEALSFDAAQLHKVPVDDLRKYIVVLGQYLITLQYEENLAEAVYVSWQKALDSHVYSLMRSSGKLSGKKMTVKEKVAVIMDEDEHARELNRQLLVAEAKKTIIRNMYRPVEQYINTLKKEIDARDQDKKRS